MKALQDDGMLFTPNEILDFEPISGETSIETIGFFISAGSTGKRKCVSVSLLVSYATFIGCDIIVWIDSFNCIRI